MGVLTAHGKVEVGLVALEEGEEGELADEEDLVPLVHHGEVPRLPGGLVLPKADPKDLLQAVLGVLGGVVSVHAHVAHDPRADGPYDLLADSHLTTLHTLQNNPHCDDDNNNKNRNRNKEKPDAFLLFFDLKGKKCFDSFLSC